MKSIKRSLIMSILSLMLCVSMLLGTTFAWFTDSVTSGKNRIVAGNLDVEMYYKNPGKTDWANVVTADSVDPKFFVDANGEDILWEPGVVSVATFKVANEGTLALKYRFATNYTDINTAGSDKKLSDVIKAAVIDGTQTYETREDAIAAGGENFAALSSFAKNNVLAAKGKTINEGEKTYDDNDTFTVILYWAPTDNDNDYNMNNGNQGKTMEIDVDIQLIATQYTAENDSFDNQYDKDAEFPDDGVDEEGEGESTVTAMISDNTVESTVSADFDPVLGFKSIEAKIPAGTFDGPVNMVVTSEDAVFFEDICISFVDPVEKDEKGNPKVINPKNLIEITKIVAAEPFVGEGYPRYYVAVDFDPEGENYNPSLIWNMAMMMASSVVYEEDYATQSEIVLTSDNVKVTIPAGTKLSGVKEGDELILKSGVTDYKLSVQLSEGATASALDIAVVNKATGKKVTATGNSKFHVELQLETGLTDSHISVFHYDDKIDAVYDTSTGILAFDTQSFSPYSEVETPYAKEYNEYIPVDAKYYSQPDVERWNGKVMLIRDNEPTEVGDIAGNTPFPELKDGDVLLCEEYVYYYNAANGGWSVGAVKNVAEPHVFVQSINGKPVNDMSCCFRFSLENTECLLTTAPEIPDTMVYMNTAFAKCGNLTKAPSVIPASVTDLSNAFKNCPLTETSSIEINATIEPENADAWQSCFWGNQRLSSGKLTLTGSSPALSKIAISYDAGQNN